MQNITPQEQDSQNKERNLGSTVAKISREDRWKTLGQRGVVVWLTGLSGSGKSTLAVALDASLQQGGRHSYLLDGDNLRKGLCRDLSFSSDDRKENMRRTGEAAKLLAEAGLVAICALISPFAAERLMVRQSCVDAGIPFLEIYVNASLQVCESRDPRGLYRRARAGEIPEFTGITSPYEPPQSCELELRTGEAAVPECVARLRALVLEATTL